MHFYLAEQENEVEALECLYYHPDEFNRISSNTFALNLVPSPDFECDNHVAVTLIVEYTPQYPEEAPICRLEKSRNLSSAQIRQLEKMILDTIEKSIGTCMIYNIADQLQSWLIENNMPQKSMHEEMMDRLEDIDAPNTNEFCGNTPDNSSKNLDETYQGIQNKTLCDPEERVDEETFLVWAQNFKKEMQDKGIWKREALNQGLSGREMFEIDSSLAGLYSFSLEDQ